MLARDDHDQLQIAYILAGASGVTVIADWDGMGQRTTAAARGDRRCSVG